MRHALRRCRRLALAAVLAGVRARRRPAETKAARCRRARTPCWRSSRRSIARRRLTSRRRPGARAGSSHVLKSGDQTAYVPFRLTLGASADGFKSAVMYVRAVSRHDGMRASEEHPSLRDWLLRGGDVAAAACAKPSTSDRRDAGRRPGDRVVAATSTAAPRRSAGGAGAAAARVREAEGGGRGGEEEGGDEGARSVPCSRSRNTTSSTLKARAAEPQRSSGRWRCRRANTTSSSGCIDRAPRQDAQPR